MSLSEASAPVGDASMGLGLPGVAGGGALATAGRVALWVVAALAVVLLILCLVAVVMTGKFWPPWPFQKSGKLVWSARTGQNMLAAANGGPGGGPEGGPKRGPEGGPTDPPTHYIVFPQYASERQQRADIAGQADAVRAALARGAITPPPRVSSVMCVVLSASGHATQVPDPRCVAGQIGGPIRWYDAGGKLLYSGSVLTNQDRIIQLLSPPS
jgi:hypothetical protein